jgi:adenylate cyclase
VGRAGDKVRITAQLVDAITGNKLFLVERDEGELKDIFALQDEITMKILTALQVKLTEEEQARVWAKGTDNPETYLKFLKAAWLLVDFKQENLELARQLAEEAVALDFDYPSAYITLAATYHYEVWYSLTESPSKSLEKAFELVQKALALDESSAAHQQLSVIYVLKKEFDKAVAEAELAVDLNPNSADAHANLARHLINVGRPEKGITLFKKAIRLNPFAPSWYYLNVGFAYWMMNQHKDSFATLKKGIERNSNAMFIQMALAVNYIELGRAKEARASIAEVLRITPEISLEWIAKMIPWRNKAEIDRFVDGLRKAGLK